MKLRDWLILLALLATIGVWHYAHRPVRHAPGVLVPEAPLQTDLAADAPPPWRKGDVAIKPLARFEIDARVLSRADYHWDRESALVPTDLALGWGRMSDSSVLDEIDISQSGRFYFWQTTREPPIPQREIIESSANMHLIPADRDVQRAIDHVRVGDVVHFGGYLVEADGPNGWRWISSLTRTDSGFGACELVWVEQFSVR